MLIFYTLKALLQEKKFYDFTAELQIPDWGNLGLYFFGHENSF